MSAVGLVRLGVVPYGQALALQLKLREQLLENPHLSGWIICLEHPPTVTLGRRGTVADLISPTFLAQKGVEVFQIDRGGEATYHGPGQLVIYPIVRLDNLSLGVVDLIRRMAQTLADTCEVYGVECHYDLEHPGVWTHGEQRRKIASVGMRVSGGITTHGAAINLVNDMAAFSWIVPCGMPDAPMVRLSDLAEVEFTSFREMFLERLAHALGIEFDIVELSLPDPEEWLSPLTVPDDV
jgi:lipoyl(octanoyl) transferase